MRKDVFVSKRLKAIYLLKSLSCYFPLPLDSVILPLVSRKPYHWMCEEQARVIVQSQRKLVGRFSNCRKGIRSFTEGNIEGASRDYELIIKGLC